jgi:hypothetical protein
MISRLLPRAAAALLVLVFSGCVDLGPSADPSQFFTLSSIAGTAKSGQVTPGDEGKAPSLGIGPIKLPAYLDREGIVTRKSENRIEISEIDRWAEPLREEVSQVLSQNLAALLRTDRILTYPWQVETEPAFQVGVEVLRFEAAEDRTARLRARWGIWKADEKKPVSVKESVLTRPVEGSGTEAAVAALSLLLGDLSRELAKGIEAASGQAKK